MTSLSNSTEIPNKPAISQFSTPRIMLHLEALVVLIASIVLYFNQGFGTLTFFALLLAPDLAFIVYAIDQEMGILAYNVAHLVAFPAVLIAVGVVGDWSAGVQFGLIWLSHIMMDRTIGYGLKYPDDFKHTHMQNV